jgi:hypothetical protein
LSRLKCEDVTQVCPPEVGWNAGKLSFMLQTRDKWPAFMHAIKFLIYKYIRIVWTRLANISLQKGLFACYQLVISSGII